MKRTTVVWSPYDKVSRPEPWSTFSCSCTHRSQISSPGTRHVCICAAGVLCALHKDRSKAKQEKGPRGLMEKTSWLFLCLGDNNKGATGNLSRRGFELCLFLLPSPCQWPILCQQSLLGFLAPSLNRKTHFCNTCIIKHLSTIFTFFGTSLCVFLAQNKHDNI